MHSRAVRAALSQLSFASKLFIAAILVHFLLFLPKDLVDPMSVVKLVWATSSLLCIVGFMMASAHLGLASEIADLGKVKSAWEGRAGRQARASAVLMFYFAFLAPMLNVVIALYVLIRIRMGFNQAELAAQYAREAAARRDKFRPG